MKDDTIIELAFTETEKDLEWTAQDVTLSGDAVLKVTLPSKGRLAIRKSNDGEKFPIVLMSPWTGPDFYVWIFGQTDDKIIRIQTTAEPTSATLYNL